MTSAFVILGEANSQYDLNYDNSSEESFKQLEELNNLTQDIQNSSAFVNPDSSAGDILGSIFTSGYQSLLLIKNSFTTFDTMMDAAIIQLGLGQFGVLAKSMLYAMAIVVVFLTIVLGAIIKARL